MNARIKRRDTNVHQHLLRGLRRSTARALGATVQGETLSNADILEASVTEACVELDLIAEFLDLRADQRGEQGSEDPVGYMIRGLRQRLDLALQLGEGLFDPDRPFVTASASDYHAGGVEAGIAAGCSEDAEGSAER